MGILVDIIILALIAISVFIGYKRGLIKCAVNILSFFIAIIVVLLLTTPITNLIVKNTQIDDNLKASISEKFDFDSEDVGQIKLDDKNSVAPDVIKDYINDTVKDLTKDAKDNVADKLSENIAVLVIKLCVAIVLFVGTRIALIFVKVIADLIAKIPLIKQFNKAGGIIYGILSGFVKVYLILALISIVVSILPESSLIDAINKSMIGSGMYNNNLLLKIIL